MNPVLILTRNNLELTKKCVESVRGQDIATSINILDNGSNDGTDSETVDCDTFWEMGINKGVSYGWNFSLDALFNARGANHILVLNNDTIIPPWFYRRLLNYNAPFVTGVAVDREIVEEPPFDPLDLNEHPDFSAFLIRRSAWDTIGPFDETMKIYCSDCDYHIRAHRLGLTLWKSNSPYYHVNSQTLKRADPEDRAAIEAQANFDRERFKELYGCLPGTGEYMELFK